MITISKELALPLDVVTQTIAILARKRAGKSFLCRRICEQLFKSEQQVVIADPKGDWWGIRSSADGKAPGLPVIILGGEHADVPLEPTAQSGELVAKLVVEERVSALLDLGQMRKHEMRTLMTAFMETMYRLKAREEFRTPMMFAIDEADMFAPQKPMQDEARMLGAVDDIVRRGGQRGIGCMFATQRSAVLNKNILSQAQILVALRTIAPQDLKAMDAWIENHGTLEQRKVLMESLPALPTGTAWFWSPGWPDDGGIFKCVQVQPIETFDSGATPRAGQKQVVPKTIADIDLTLLRKQMASTLERVEADNPKPLRAKIATLERQVAALTLDLARSEKRATTGPVKVKTIEKQVVGVKAISGIKKCETQLRGYLKNIRAAHEDGIAFANFYEREVNKLIDELRKVESAQVPHTHTEEVGSGKRDGGYNPGKQSSAPNPPSFSAFIDASAKLDKPNGTLGEGERKVLIAIAQYPRGATREQITVLTGYKRSTRDAYIQRLRAAQCIQVNGDAIVATTHGIGTLGDDFRPLPTGAPLRKYWMDRLPDGERKLFSAVVEMYPNAIERAMLDQFGFARSSRDAYLQRLAARQLIKPAGRSAVKAADTLFE